MDGIPPTHLAEHGSTSSIVSTGPLAAFEAKTGDWRYFSPRSLLFNEGVSRPHLFILEHGWAFAYRTFRDGRRHVVEMYVPGDVIGLAEAWSGTPGPGVAALTDVGAVPLARADLAAQVGRSPDAAAALMSALADTAGTLSLRTTSLARQTAYERVAYLIWSLRARTRPLPGRDGRTFQCPVPQAIMADALGLSAVHINRSLSQLARDGVLQKHTQEVEILDPDALARIART